MPEVQRQKNTATRVAFPLVDSSTRPAYRTGALTGVVVSAYSWRDGQALAALTIAGTPSHAGVGLWELALTAGEMNPDSGGDDYIIIKVNSNETDEQSILIRLTPYQADMTRIGGDSIAGNVATLTLKELNVTNSAGTAVTMKSTGGAGLGLDVAGQDTGPAARFKAGDNAPAIDAEGGDCQGEAVRLVSPLDHVVTVTPGASSTDKVGVKVVAGPGAAGHAVQLTGAGTTSGDTLAIDNAHGYDAVSLDATGAGEALDIDGGTTGISVASDGTGIRVRAGTTGDGHAVDLQAAEKLNSIALRIHGPNTVTGRGIDVEGGHGAGSKAVSIVAPSGKVIHAVGYDDVILDLDGSGGSSVTGVAVRSEGSPAVLIDADNASGVKIESNGFCLDLDSDGANAVDIQSTNGHGIYAFGTGAGLRVRGTANPDLDAGEIGTPGNLGGGASLAQNLVDMAGSGFTTGTDSLEAIRDRGDAAWITATGFSTLDAQGVRDAMKLTPAGGAPAAGSIDEHLDTIVGKLPAGDISGFDPTSDAVDLNADQSGVTIGTVNALGAQAKADVNAEVDGALDELIPEPVAGAPAATCSVRTGIARQYSIARNQGDLNGTAGEKVYYNSSGVAISKKAVSDDGTTYSESAMTGV